jgi:tetratricopeptide (TPR) repeat protein
VKPRHIILFVSIVSLLAIIGGAAVGFDPKESAAATQTASADVLVPAQPAESTNTPQSSVQVTPTLVPATQNSTTEQTSKPHTAPIRDWFGKAFGFLHRVNNMVQELWSLLLGLGILLLAVALMMRVADETSGRHIEFDTLQNGTGDAAFSESLTGMNAYIREKLISNIKYLQDIIIDYSYRTSPGSEFPMQIPLPQDVQTLHTLDKVVDALGEESPKYLKPLVSLWRYLYPGRGLRIRTTLQSNSDPTRPLRITFEFLDLGTQRNSIVHTIEEEQELTPSMPPWILCGKEVLPSKEKSAREPPSPASADQGKSDPWSVHVGRALRDARQYADAITYYEQALALKKEDEQTIKDLFFCQQRLPIQAGSAAGFAAAMQLEESGLLEAAVKGYSNLFTEPEDILVAAQLWQVALRLQPGSVGEALGALAGLYREKLDLHDEAVGLYKRAVKEGHRPSAENLKRIQNREAVALAEAGRWLLDNAQWVAAETYLTKAAACAPDHEPTLRIQARLKASRPTQENKEALADFELGKVYQAQGRQASAIEYYTKAIEKQPDYAEAKNALSDILKETYSLRYRFEILAEKAVEWLTVELLRQETDRLAGSVENQLAGALESQKARYHNFYGAYYISLFWMGPSFADLAEKELQAAKKICPDWFMPYKQLGDLYLLKGRIQINGRQEPAVVKKAAVWYKIALSKKAMGADGTLSCMEQPLKLRLQVEWAAAELLACSENLNALWAYIQAAETYIGKSKEAFKDIEVKKKFQDLYRNLAIWYALVDYRYQKSGDPCGSTQPRQAKFWAWFYLICAVLLDPNRLRQINKNPVQKALYTDEQYLQLKTEIEIRRQEQQAKTDEQPSTWEDVRMVMKSMKLDIEIDFKEN